MQLQHVLAVRAMMQAVDVLSGEEESRSSTPLRFAPGREDDARLDVANPIVRSVRLLELIVVVRYLTCTG